MKRVTGLNRVNDGLLLNFIMVSVDIVFFLALATSTQGSDTKFQDINSTLVKYNSV